MAVNQNFLGQMPAGYDDRTRLFLREDNQVVATHPENPPLLLKRNGQWVEIQTQPVHPAHSSSTC